jgi:hypothetical protein
MLALAAVAACAPASDDELSLHATINIRGGTDARPAKQYSFGVPGTVSATGTRDVGKPCTVGWTRESGGPVGCTGSRKVASRILSIECAPQGACTKVSFEGSEGSFLALTDHVRVRVVADFEGERREREAAFDYVDPVTEVSVTPRGRSTVGEPPVVSTDVPFAGGDVEVCLITPSGAAPTFDASLDGTLLVPESIAGTDGRPPSCSILRVPGWGALTIAPRLVEPAHALGTATFPIHPLTEITSVSVRDSYCEGEGLHAFARGSHWIVGLAAVVGTDEGKTGLMPGHAVRAYGSRTTPKRTTADGVLTPVFVTEDGDDDLTVVVDNGTRTWTFPVTRVAQCVPRKP